MTSRKNNSNRTLSFQALEDRKMMTANLASKALIAHLPAPAVVAPNVTTSVSSKHVLTITGDANSDSITITQTAPNEFTLTGTNGTTINKTHTTENFTGVVGDVDVVFKGGTGTSASLNIGASSPITFNANLNVNMGNGSNSFSMTDATVKESMSLTGGSSHDFAFISNSAIGIYHIGIIKKLPAHDLSINLGGGQNSLVIENNVTVERDLNVNDANGTGELIYIGENVGGVSVGRNLEVGTGSGADSVTLNGLTVKGDLHVVTGAGNDQLTLGGSGDTRIAPVYADSVFVDLGAGDDVLTIGAYHSGGVYGTTPTSFPSYDGGAGHDTWNNDSGFYPFGSFADFEVNNS